MLHLRSSIENGIDQGNGASNVPLREVFYRFISILRRIGTESKLYNKRELLVQVYKLSLFDGERLCVACTLLFEAGWKWSTAGWISIAEKRYRHYW